MIIARDTCKWSQIIKRLEIKMNLSFLVLVEKKQKRAEKNELIGAGF